MVEKQDHLEQKRQRKARKLEIKRSTIIVAAEKEFIDKGFDNAMIDQIALSAGYTKASIYNYFDSKDDIFTAVLSKIYDLMFETFSAYFSVPKNTSGIRSIGDAYLSFVEKYYDKAALIDSGRCVTINRQIIYKMENGEELSASEHAFTKSEERVAKYIAQILAQDMQKSLPAQSTLSQILKILGAFMPVLRELIRRGVQSGQTIEQVRENLSILFTIVETGVKNYESS